MDNYLFQVLEKANNNDDIVFFNNYQSYEREDGCPSKYKIDFNEYEDEITSIFDLDIPEYDKEGCNDLVIYQKDTKKYFYIWYSDNYEDRVYLDAILEYLNI